MAPPTPPSPPVISRQSHDDDNDRKSSSRRSNHRSGRDYRASRSRSKGRGRSSRVSSDRDRKHRQRSRSRSRSRGSSRYHRKSRIERSSSRHRHEGSPSMSSRVRSDRRRRSNHRSRSRSYSKSHKTSHRSKSRSRSNSRSRRHQNQTRSRSKSHNRVRSTSSGSKHRELREGSSSNKQPNVIVLSTESYKDSLKMNSKLPSVREEASTSTSSTSTTVKKEETPSWKSTKVDQVGVYSNLEPDAPIDKEKIQKEIEEKLRLALAREGKVYPHPKPEPSHPVFANDGSFLEIFKKMQQQQTFVQQQVGESMQIHAVPTPPVAPVAPVAPVHHHPPPPQLPIFGRRRGGKILKTGVVAKPSASNETETGDVKDFWSIYLREVKKYKSTACESDSKTRPLVR